MDNPELSVVIPFLNEERVLPLLRQRLEKLRARAPAWELLFISDGSTDASVNYVETWARHDPKVKLVILTRNFGHQNAISAGLLLASGNYIGIMDADLQDDPETLLEMYNAMRTEHLDVIYAVRSTRSETAMKRALYAVFYRAFLFLSDTPIHMDSGDFCVLSRRAVRLLLDLPEKLRFVRGLRAWLGLQSRPFPVARGARAAGRPQYSFPKLLTLAASGLTSFSTKPLRIGFFCGAILCLGAVLAGFGYLALALFSNIHIAAPGFSTLVVFLLFSNGLVFLYLGILGEYLGQMFLEIKGRPSFIIERTVNLDREIPSP
jgi:dolichol-phosphate mannosyltransferase